MKTSANNNIESVNATRRAASKNNVDVDALRKLATEMIGTTLQWPNGQQYRLASFEKVTKNKVTFWLSEPPCHHGVSVMDISRTMLEHLQATGEHRTDCGTTVTVNREEEKPLAYIAYCRGIAQDIFTDWGKAVADLSRHVYNTLQDCCGGKVSKESESRYQVYFKKSDEWEVCEVVPVDLNRPQDREAYKAQHERLGLPALETLSEITEKPQPSSWVTDYTYDDFAKLKANPEAIEADPDIMGKRFRLTAKDGSAPLSELQVFIQDYAGNERHALYYIWDEWMQEVRANVRPLDWLREHFCHANGWQPVAA